MKCSAGRSGRLYGLRSVYRSSSSGVRVSMRGQRASSVGGHAGTVNNSSVVCTTNGSQCLSSEIKNVVYLYITNGNFESRIK